MTQHNHTNLPDTIPDSVIKVAALPFDTVQGDVEANLRNASQGIAALQPDTDIAVLPELFSTGFIVDPTTLSRIAEPCNGPTMAWAAGMARSAGCAVAGSFLSYRDGAYYNTAFFAEPCGRITFYDKRHLFCLSPEAKLYGQGDTEMPVINFRGWNIAMIVCYDLRFPVWCRNDRQRYDLMLVPANWPTARGYAWHHLIVARALENQTPWVGADRSGADDYGVYNGLAEIVDATGKVVAQATEADPSTPIYATFSKSQLQKYRGKLPVGADADSFSIITPHPLAKPHTSSPEPK